MIAHLCNVPGAEWGAFPLTLPWRCRRLWLARDMEPLLMLIGVSRLSES